MSGSRTKLMVVMLGLVALSALLGPGATGAQAQEVQWQTIIGIIQAGNVVRGIPGGGQPWSTTGGEAAVDLGTGDIAFRVTGLVLAGGDAIGTRANITEVRGTVVCGNSARADTPLVPLSAQGDAEFSGNVAIPPGCDNTVFLIRIPAGRWIANGSVRIP